LEMMDIMVWRESRYQLTELNGGASPSDTCVRFCVGVSVGCLVVCCLVMFDLISARRRVFDISGGIYWELGWIDIFLG
jgi:hypothetical protein